MIIQLHLSYNNTCRKIYDLDRFHVDGKKIFYLMKNGFLDTFVDRGNNTIELDNKFFLIRYFSHFR